MAILEFILIFLFVLLMAFLIIGFNRQMLENLDYNPCLNFILRKNNEKKHYRLSKTKSKWG